MGIYNLAKEKNGEVPARHATCPLYLRKQGRRGRKARRAGNKKNGQTSANRDANISVFVTYLNYFILVSYFLLY